MQETALEYMGENKASYMMKAGIDSLPEADQDVSHPSLPFFMCGGVADVSSQEIKGIRKNAKNVMGEGMKNPLGKQVSIVT